MYYDFSGGKRRAQKR